jgi:hypothetical protein
MLEAARTSFACGLAAQAERLLERVESALPPPSEGPRTVAIQVAWNASGLPSASIAKREEELWRKVRSLRSRRRPYDGAQIRGVGDWPGAPLQSGFGGGRNARMRRPRRPFVGGRLLERDRAAGAIERLLGIND